MTSSMLPTNDEGRRLDPDHDQGPAQQPPVPLDLAQQPVGDREGDEEEADVLQALREVLRVEHLQRVEDHGGGQQPGECPRRVSRRRVGPIAQQASPAPRRRSPSRAGPAGSRCRRRRAAGPGTESRRRSPVASGSASGGTRRRVRRSRRRPAPAERAIRPSSWRRSTIWAVCHWSPAIRTGKRTIAATISDGAQPPGRQQDRGAARHGGDQQAAAGKEVAQGLASGVTPPAPPVVTQLDFAPARARCSLITPGVTRVRSDPSLTRSL